jgi:hypothetical protein
MKKNNHYSSIFMHVGRVLILLLLCFNLRAQEESQGMEPENSKAKLVKNTFESNWILDNQSVMVPIKGTFEMDIQHRFGVFNNGYEDFYGVFAPSNIRLGFSYTFIDKLQLGFGLTKERLQWDFNAKYALIRQATSGGWPFSLTYFGNIVVDTRAKENFVTGTDRLSYFHQLILARKITDRISIQVAPSLSHFNNVEGYKDAEGNIQKKLENDHFAIAFGGRFKVTESMSILVNYDQPLTTHPLNNPHPNINFGVEFVTSAHAFEVLPIKLAVLKTSCCN